MSEPTIHIRAKLTQASALPAVKLSEECESGMLYYPVGIRVENGMADGRLFAVTGTIEHDGWLEILVTKVAS